MALPYQQLYGLNDLGGKTAANSAVPTFQSIGTAASIGPAPEFNSIGQKSFNSLDSASQANPVIRSAVTSGGGTTSHINPATGAWDDNWFASQNKAAQDQNAALLSQLNTQYDYNAAQAQNQLSALGNQKNDTLSQLDTQLAGVQSQVGNAKTNAQTQADKNTQDALATAQEVERKNRNALRALGILNSSAAGEQLSKPYNEYDRQRATIAQALTSRIGELDDFLNQKVAEHADAVKSVLTQFNDLTGRIQTDLRFNDRQRADAIQSANAALSQRLAEIQNSMFNYKAQVESLKNSYSTGLNQLSQYVDPTANLAAIQAQGVSGVTTPQAQTAQIYTPEDPTKKKQGALSGFLSGIGL